MADQDQGLEHISSSISEATITRRSFVMATLAVDFALAVRPVSAETLTTDQTGLIAGEIKIQTSDGQIPAYRAKPKQGTALPVVLVVQEIFGVHEHIKDICPRFAKLGYLAIAPELYARQGDVSKLSNIDEIIAKVVSTVPDAQVPPILMQQWYGQKSREKGMSRNSGSRASVGEEELSGCMPHITPS